MSDSSRRYSRHWPVAFALAALLLYFSLRGVEWARVWRIVAAARPQYLALAALLICVSSAFRGLRWRILLNAEADLGVWTVYRALMAGYLGNNFLPARAGELIRSLLIARRSRLSVAYVLTTALSERLMDAIALVLASSIVLLGVHPKPAWMGDVSRSLAVLAALGALAVAILPHTGALPARILQRLPMPQSFRGPLLKITEQALLGMRAFHDWARFGGFVSLTAVIWCCDTFSMMAGSRALALNLSFPVALLLLAALGLGSALPSTPGYVGIFQFVAVSVLAPFGIGKDAALAYILVTQAMGYIVVAILGASSFSLLREARRGTAAESSH